MSDLLDLSHIEPANAEFAITSMVEGDDTIGRSMGLTQERIDELAALGNALKPKNTIAALQVASYTAKTPLELMYLAYSIGTVDGEEIGSDPMYQLSKLIGRG